MLTRAQSCGREN